MGTFQHDYVTYFATHFYLGINQLGHDNVSIMRYYSHMYLRHDCVDLISLTSHITQHTHHLFYFYTKLCTSQTSVQKGASINTSKLFVCVAQVFYDDLIYLATYYDHISSSSYFDMSTQLNFSNFILVTINLTLSLTGPLVSGLVDWLGLKP